jgi:predicted DNA-binding transcriptional regulator AlpA
MRQDEPMTTRKKAQNKRKKGAKTDAVKAAEMPQKMLLTIKEVEKETGMCRESLWRRWTTGKMPKPLKLGHRTVRFRYADIRAWIDQGCVSVRSMKK